MRHFIFLIVIVFGLGVLAGTILGLLVGSILRMDPAQLMCILAAITLLIHGPA